MYMGQYFKRSIAPNSINLTSNQLQILKEFNEETKSPIYIVLFMDGP
jgi:hypothetical protein